MSTVTRSAPGGPPEGETFSALSGQRALVGGVWTTAAQIGPYVYTMFVSIAAARILGPANMGRQSFIAFAIITATTVCAAGFPMALGRFTAEALGRGSTGAVPGLLRLAWFVLCLTGLIGAGVFVVVAAQVQELRVAWLLAAVAVLGGVLHKVPGSALIGSKHWRESSLVVIVPGAIGTVATIVVLAIGGGITGMFVVTAAVSLAMLAWAAYLARRHVRFPRRRSSGSQGLRRRMLRFGLASSVPVILNFVVAQRSEFFFLEHSSTSEQVALYSIAFSTTAALLAIPAAATQVISPSVAVLYGSGELERIRIAYGRALRLVVLLTIPLTAAALSLGPPLLRLVFGQQYGGTGNILRVLAVGIPLVPAAGVSAALLVGYGRMQFPIIVSFAAATADIAFAALLVPHLDAVGAALANEAAVITAASLLIPYCVRLVGRVDMAAGRLVRMALASAAGGAAAALVLSVLGDTIGFPFAVLAGLVIFGLLAAGLRVLPGDDAAWIMEAAGPRRGRRLGQICRRLAGPPLGA